MMVSIDQKKSLCLPCLRLQKNKMKKNKVNGELKINPKDIIAMSQKKGVYTVFDNFEHIGIDRFAKLALHALEASKSSNTKH